jgi:hypothetical protein
MRVGAGSGDDGLHGADDDGGWPVGMLPAASVAAHRVDEDEPRRLGRAPVREHARQHPAVGVTDQHGRRRHAGAAEPAPAPDGDQPPGTLDDGREVRGRRRHTAMRPRGLPSAAGREDAGRHDQQREQATRPPLNSDERAVAPCKGRLRATG